MKSSVSILAMLTIVVLSSCSPKIYFTEDTKAQLERANVDLHIIQYYNSEPIVLARQIKKEDVNVVSGKVKLEQGKYIEEIIIKRYTPGVFVEKNDKVLFISFEEGDGKFLPFMKLNSKSGNNPPIYQIGSLDWKTDKNGRKIGVVNYAGNKYSIVHGDNSRLLIMKSTVSKLERKSHVAKGRKVN